MRRLRIYRRVRAAFIAEMSASLAARKAKRLARYRPAGLKGWAKRRGCA